MKRTGCILALLALTAPVSAHAANHYIRQAATGAGDGSDWSNAWTDLTDVIWTRGDTYYVAGGTYSAVHYDAALSGTSVITVKGATSADHGTEQGWLPSYGVEVNQAHFAAGSYFGFSNTTGYWVIDGAVGTGLDPSSYGFVVDHTTGDEWAFVLAAGPWGVSNIVLSHFYAQSTDVSGDNDTEFIMWYTRSTHSDNITLSDSLLDYWGGVMSVEGQAGPSTGLLVEHCYIMNAYSSAAHHGNTINADGSSISNSTIRYNVFLGGTGTNIISANNSDIVSSDIYGNVFVGCQSGPGLVGGTSSGGMVGCHVYNNTFVACGAGPWFNTGTGGSENTCENNLIFSMSGAHWSGSTDTFDYNAYFQSTDTPAEAHGQVASNDPFVSSATDDFHLAAHTEPGLALGAPYEHDPDGRLRVSWDRGAYEYGTPTSSRPSAPSALRVTSP